VISAWFYCFYVTLPASAFVLFVCPVAFASPIFLPLFHMYIYLSTSFNDVVPFVELECTLVRHGRL
jgi:hypothetical protein